MEQSDKMKRMQKDRYCEQCGRFVGTYSDIDWDEFKNLHICEHCTPILKFMLAEKEKTNG